jgi:hypothetical protein
VKDIFLYKKQLADKQTRKELEKNCDFYIEENRTDTLTQKLHKLTQTCRLNLNFVELRLFCQQNANLVGRRLMRLGRRASRAFMGWLVREGGKMFNRNPGSFFRFIENPGSLFRFIFPVHYGIPFHFCS